MADGTKGKRGPRPRDENGNLLPPKNPAVPRAVYIVVDEANSVTPDGKFNKACIVTVTRSAKEALESIDKSTDRKLTYFSLMVK